MALVHDTDSRRQIGGTGANSTTHTPVGVPVGVVVMIGQGAATGTDQVTSVTYGGVAMTRIITNFDPTGEALRTYIYFLGSGVPTGAQTLTVTTSANQTKECWCCTFTGAADTEIAASAGVNDNMDDPSVVVPTLSGFAGLVYATLTSGEPALAQVTPGAGYTALAGAAAGGTDLGAFTLYAERRSASGANITANWTTDDNDNTALSAVAVQELSAPPPPPPVARVNPVRMMV